MTVDRATRPIAESDVDRYQHDGAIRLRDAFDRNWIDVLARGFERNLAEPGPNAARYTPEGNPGGYIDDFCNWQRIEEYRDFVFNSPAAAIAGRLMRSAVARLFLENMLIKEPGTLEVTPWHQDLPYYCVDGSKLASIWLPLDPVPRAACPEFVAGSHRWGKVFTPRRFVDLQDYQYPAGTFDAVPDIDGQRERYEILAWDIEPGDCIVFDMRTLHGAPNTARLATRRRAFSTRWLGDDAVYAKRPGKTFPTLPELGLQPGDPLDRPMFPVLWRADTGIP